MQSFSRIGCQLLCFALLSTGLALKLDAGKNASKPLKATAAAPPKASKDEVELVHRKLEKVAAGLEKMLGKGHEGSLSDAKVAPMLQTFLKELRTTLASTAAPKDYGMALKKLRNAEAGIADLTSALSQQQAALMHQGAEEEASLLLGVLMARKGESFEKQLEVLQSPDFRNLAVSKDLLAKMDKTTPLVQQVAAWMDKHSDKKTVAAADEKATKLSKTLLYFSKRVETLKREGERMKKVHDMSVSRIEELIKNSLKNEKHKYELLKRRSDRQYRKNSAVQASQLKMMENVVTALRRGDVSALRQAQEALQASMRAMKQQTGNFLHLLQLGHRLASQDCPYCAAQCIDKCHNEGKAFSECLTVCQDAGK